MAIPKTLRSMAGTSTRQSDITVATPRHWGDVAAAVTQLQNTVNELQQRHNTHQHSALNAAPSTGLVDGTGATQLNLFTAS